MTYAPATLTALQTRMVRNLHTTNLGIVGDAAHIRDGGYHIGAASLRRNGMGGDYSLYFSADRNATHDAACAIDIGGSASTLMTLGNRIVKALKARDPRVYKRVRAVNAPWGGISIDRRYDCESPASTSDDNTQASSDRGHIHVEFYRTLVFNQAVIDGFYSVISGVGSTATAPAPSGKLYQGAPIPSLIAKGTGQYYGLITGPNASHGGALLSERTAIKMIQRRLELCGFVPGHTNPYDGWADGIFETPTRDAVSRFQHAKMPGTTRFGEIWYDDWYKLFHL